MLKTLVIIFTFVAFTFIGRLVVSAQTNTPTVTPTPTSTDQTPQGAPNTGYGTVR